MPDNYYFHNRFFSVGDVAVLAQQEMHHLVHVMRCKKMELVQLINGQGQLCSACIINIDRHSVELKVLDIQTKPLPKKKTILVQTLTRPQKLELIFEKCVELGVDEIILFAGDKSEIKKPSPSQDLRLNSIMISAMKQSGRLHLPQYSFMETLSDLPFHQAMYFFGDLREGAPSLIPSLQSAPKDAIIGWVSGPEKGFSDREVDLLIHKGAKGCTLGPNILRAETAAIAGTTLITSFKYSTN